MDCVESRWRIKKLQKELYWQDLKETGMSLKEAQECCDDREDMWPNVPSTRTKDWTKQRAADWPQSWRRAWCQTGAGTPVWFVPCRPHSDWRSLVSECCPWCPHPTNSTMTDYKWAEWKMCNAWQTILSIHRTSITVVYKPFWKLTETVLCRYVKIKLR